MRGLGMKRSYRKTPLTAEQLLALPSTVDIVMAGNAMGMSRAKSYQMLQNGEWPDEVPVRRLGNRLRVPTAPLLRYLGIERPAHTTDTPRSARGGKPTDASSMRRKIDPSKRYRLKNSGEVVTGAEILRRRAAS